MPLILALDTTGAAGNIALLQGPQFISSLTLPAGVHYDSSIFPALEDLLSRAKTSINGIDAFAAAAGPGTFTGVRTGLTIVKALGEALARPVFGVSCLECLLRASPETVKAALIDARRGMVYARYESPGAPPAEVLEPLESWLAHLNPAPAAVVLREPQLSSAVASCLPGAAIILNQDGLAVAAGLLAYQRYLAGERPDPASLDASYLRRADADLKWRDPKER